MTRNCVQDSIALVFLAHCGGGDEKNLCYVNPQSRDVFKLNQNTECEIRKQILNKYWSVFGHPLFDKMEEVGITVMNRDIEVLGLPLHYLAVMAPIHHHIVEQVGLSVLSAGSPTEQDDLWKYNTYFFCASDGAMDIIFQMNCVPAVYLISSWRN